MLEKFAGEGPSSDDSLQGGPLGQTQGSEVSVDADSDKADEAGDGSLSLQLRDAAERGIDNDIDSSDANLQRSGSEQKESLDKEELDDQVQQVQDRGEGHRALAADASDLEKNEDDSTTADSTDE